MQVRLAFGRLATIGEAQCSYTPFGSTELWCTFECCSSTED